MPKLKLQYFGHLMWRADLLERPWCWERLKVGEQGDNRGWDGWMASPTRWTWVWTNPGRWWRTGKPGTAWLNNKFDPNFKLWASSLISSVFNPHIIIKESTIRFLDVPFIWILSLVFSKTKFNWFHYIYLCFLGGSDSKESACNARDPESFSGWERSPGEWNGYPNQYSCLENPHGQRSLSMCVCVHTRTCVYIHTLIYVHINLYIHFIYIYQTEDWVNVPSILLVNRNPINYFNKFILSNFVKFKYKINLLYKMNLNSIYFSTFFNHNKEKWSHRHVKFLYH